MISGSEGLEVQIPGFLSPGVAWTISQNTFPDRINVVATPSCNGGIRDRRRRADTTCLEMTYENRSRKSAAPGNCSVAEILRNLRVKWNVIDRRGEKAVLEDGACHVSGG